VLPKGRMGGATDETGLIGDVTSAHRERRRAGERKEQTGRPIRASTRRGGGATDRHRWAPTEPRIITSVETAFVEEVNKHDY
jgi:hypothetical protein